MKTAVLASFKRAIIPAFAITALAFSLVNSARANTGGIPARPNQASPFTAIYVLGDSLSDTGRTAAALTQDPLHPFPPPPYAPGRLSNGALWIEYFAPMVHQTYNPLTNLAWAGATTGLSNVEASFLPGMKFQLDEAVNGGIDRSALYIIFGGPNDFLQVFPPISANPYPIVTSGVQNVVTMVATLHAFGAENIVVVGVPDFGLIPRATALGKARADTATQLSMTFNSLLDTSLNSLGFSVCRVNLFDLFRDVVSQPKKYGFTDVSTPSFPNLAKATTSLFWDDVHPTTLGHRYIAEEVYREVSKSKMLKVNAK